MGWVAPVDRMASMSCCMPAARQPSPGIWHPLRQQPSTLMSGLTASGWGSLNNSKTIEWSFLNVDANDRQKSGALAASGITCWLSPQGEYWLPGGDEGLDGLTVLGGIVVRLRDGRDRRVVLGIGGPAEPAHLIDHEAHRI